MRLIVPLGPSGARHIQFIDLGRNTAQHALVAGKTGSGKSTLLHVLFTSLALKYSPEEVQLYLVDFKKGVEFKPYASWELPHARVVSIESEREFGLSVLEGLDAELKRRGDLFRAQGVAEYSDYRRRAGRALPRLLLLVDEFQEFFTEDDPIASNAGRLLDRLVRQGRGFGIHVLLGSQTLAGAYSLARSTIDQMAVRIALQCSEADSRLVLADDNPAARLLSRPGEAIYNAENGRVEGNHLFQTAWLSDEQHADYLAQVRRLAQESGYRPPQPQIIFEGSAPAEIRKNQALADRLRGAAPAGGAPLAWLGEPVAIRDPVAAGFRRQSGANLLLAGGNEPAAQALAAAALLGLGASIQPARRPADGPAFYLLDFSAAEALQANPFTPFCQRLPGAVRGGRRQLAEILPTLAAEVQRRLDANETAAPARFLMIFGLQRARDLRSDDSYGMSSYGEQPAAQNLPALFAAILRDGPEVGVHTLVWCDTLTNLNRSLERRALREFSLRVVLQMSAEDSASLVESPAAARLGLHRALFYDEDAALLEKFRPYSFPDEQWLAWAFEQLGGA